MDDDTIDIYGAGRQIICMNHITEYIYYIFGIIVQSTNSTTTASCCSELQLLQRRAEYVRILDGISYVPSSRQEYKLLKYIRWGVSPQQTILPRQAYEYKSS